jgi:hypothetical protein
VDALLDELLAQPLLLSLLQRDIKASRANEVTYR